jgi:hypothetical protein
MHHLQAWRTLGTFFAEEYLVATEPIKCLVPPGKPVICSVLSTATSNESYTVFGSCSISGYLEDVLE